MGVKGPIFNQKPNEWLVFRMLIMRKQNEGKKSSCWHQSPATAERVWEEDESFFFISFNDFSHDALLQFGCDVGLFD